MVEECPRCGWPQDQVYEVLSRHVTSEGVVSYTRCACGEIQVRIHPYRLHAEAGEVVGAGSGTGGRVTQVDRTDAQR